MSDRLALEDAITSAEAEAAIHDLVENGILGLNAIDPAGFDLKAPKDHVLVVMTVGQRQGLIESGARLRKAVDEISRTFYAAVDGEAEDDHGR